MIFVRGVCQLTQDDGADGLMARQWPDGPKSALTAESPSAGIMSLAWALACGAGDAVSLGSRYHRWAPTCASLTCISSALFPLATVRDCDRPS
jgi:hypothetical protein